MNENIIDRKVKNLTQSAIIGFLLMLLVVVGNFWFPASKLYHVFLILYGIFAILGTGSAFIILATSSFYFRQCEHVFKSIEEKTLNFTNIDDQTKQIVKSWPKMQNLANKFKITSWLTTLPFAIFCLFFLQHYNLLIGIPVTISFIIGLYAQYKIIPCFNKLSQKTRCYIA